MNELLEECGFQGDQKLADNGYVSLGLLSCLQLETVRSANKFRQSEVGPFPKAHSPGSLKVKFFVSRQVLYPKRSVLKNGIQW